MATATSGCDIRRPTVITFFTKPGCTLCDKALEVLQTATHPFVLRTVNIDAEGNEEWRARYWCDIPVFHVDGAFWAKHKLESVDVDSVLDDAATGDFKARAGEPDMRGSPPPEHEETSGCGGECCEGKEGCGGECCGGDHSEPHRGATAVLATAGVSARAAGAVPRPRAGHLAALLLVGRFIATLRRRHRHLSGSVQIA